MNNEDTENDIIDSVKAYASAHGLNIMNVYIVYNKFCFNLVGCKISVPESDKMKATQPDFWPSEITCRVWEKFKPVSIKAMVLIMMLMVTIITKVADALAL